MSSLIKLTGTIHFLEQFIIYNACMYLCMYTNIIRLRMIKARIRWCTCRVENILTLGKLLSLWFCFLLHSILFLISQTSYRTYKIISGYELARPIMGTIFLVYICRYVSYVKLLRRRNYVAHAHAQSHFWVVKTDL